MELESESYGVGVWDLWSWSLRVEDWSPRVVQFESKSYWVGVRELWRWGPRVMEFESDSYGVWVWEFETLLKFNIDDLLGCKPNTRVSASFIPCLFSNLILKKIKNIHRKFVFLHLCLQKEQRKLFNLSLCLIEI